MRSPSSVDMFLDQSTGGSPKTFVQFQADTIIWTTGNMIIPHINKGTDMPIKIQGLLLSEIIQALECF